MKNIFSITVLLIAFISSGYSQPMSKNTFENNMKVGSERFEKGDYYNALELFKKAAKQKKDPEVTFRIAEAYFMLRDYKHAERYLKKLIKKDKNGVFQYAKLLHAKCLKRMEKYQEAFDEFRKLAQKTNNPDIRDEAILEIKGLEMFSSLEENLDIEIAPLKDNINKGYSIYGASKNNNENKLFFGSYDTKSKIVLDGKNDDKGDEVSSNDDNNNEDFEQEDSDNSRGKKSRKSKGKKKRKKNKKGKKNKKSRGSKFSRIMYSDISSGSYSDPVILANKKINNKEYHSMYPAFSDDGYTMYYTRVAMKSNVVLESNILVSEYKEGEWSTPIILDKINGDFISKMPAVGEILGQEAIFFVSDMEGTLGGFDIFYCLINSDGTLGDPVNLGDKINTKDDEITPYYVDGKLYYSTNGLPGLGGFDIYVSNWNGKNWSEPENMGKGFNSSVDDLGLSISKNAKFGYMLSNRKYKGKKKLLSETCCNHVYEISARDLLINLMVQVFDKDGELNNATVELVDNSKANPDDIATKSNFNGNTILMSLKRDKPYSATVSREGYEPAKIEFTTAGIFDDFTIEKKVTLVKEEPEVEIVTINQAIRLNNIYYDYDDYKILPSAEADLEKLMDIMLEYPDMVIELSSHTDSRGPDKYNNKLSQKRAESAKNWLVENGIESERIVPVGYGETKILNHCTEGKECTDEEHRFNRRTEFKILKGPKEITIKKEVFKDKNKGKDKNKSKNKNKSKK